MYELSVIVPTFNERDNIEPLVGCLKAALQGIAWELVFVDDDSTDGTLDILHMLASENTNIRFIHRVHQRGLATACIEGMLSSVAPFVAVMDADLQHDERILPEMLHAIKSQTLDLVVGSRHVSGGSMGTMPKHRVLVSKIASKMSHLFLRHTVTDPMSGFFMLRRGLLIESVHDLSASGYKLLLDIIVSLKPKSILEIPYNMRHRQFGESKLDTLVILEYLQFLLEKTVGNYVPVRFIFFILVGISGVFVNLLFLGVLNQLLKFDFMLSQGVAIIAAMSSNFWLNNIITHRDKRLHGIDMLKGLMSFYLACSF